MAENKVYPSEDAGPTPNDPETAENAEVPTKPPVLMKVACGCLTQTNPVRAACIKIIEHPPESAENKSFDMFITVFIVINTVVLCLPNTSVCTSPGDCDWMREPTQADIYDFNNAMEWVFNIVFFIECVVKVIALGFINGPNAYLKESWNILDFIVVVSSVLTAPFIPEEISGSLPNLRMLRTFRMLRPLKSVNKLPGLKKLIVAMLNSIPRLANVLFLLVFLLYIFSIIGITFFMGLQYNRCRITAWPTKWPGPLTTEMPMHSTNCTTDHPCFALYEELIIASINSDTPDEFKCRTDLDTLDKWDKQEDCIWLLNPEDERICSLLEGSGGQGIGLHECRPTDSYFSKPAWCGSNFDPTEESNPRFINSDIPYGFDRMMSGTYAEGLNFGFTTFDNLPAAFVSIFQSVTFEGWVDIKYQVMDGYNGFITSVFFAALVIFGGHLVLNLVLAVITSAIDELNDEAEDEAAAEENKEGAPHMLGETHNEEEEGAEDEPEDHIPGYRKLLHDIVLSRSFTVLVFLVIFANTVVLSMDRHPISEDVLEGMKRANEVFTWFFIFELVLKVAALTPKYYIKDNYNIFDAFIVLMSIIEMIGGDEGGPISGLRAVRVFRVFKMAKEWKSLNTLLKNLFETVGEIANFAILLGLFILIFSLVGMQLFAGQMHFDDNGLPVQFVTQNKFKIRDLEGPRGENYKIADVVGCDEWPVCEEEGEYYFTSKKEGNGFVPQRASQADHDAYYGAEVSRANFDDLFQSVMTIFQILTGENWNAAMYDGLRVGGWGAFFFYFAIIVIGMFFVMNIFLAILLSKFEGNDEIVSAPGDSGSSSMAQIKQKFRDSLSVISTSPAKSGQSKDYKVSPEGETAENSTADSASAEAQTSTQPPVPVGEDKALYLFAKDNPLRIKCENQVKNPKFDNIIMVIILLSSLTLAYDNPMRSPERGDVQFIAFLDIIFTIIFLYEMVVKIITYGFVFNGKDSYLTGSAWNRLDFIIVVVALLEMGKVDMPPGMRAIRTIRVLRPIRMVARQKELRLVLDALLTSVPQVMNVLIVCLLFFLIFSVIFVNLYKGTFEGCGGGDGMPDISAVGQDFIQVPPQWTATLEASSLEFIQHFNEGACYNKYYLDQGTSTPMPSGVCKTEGERYKNQRDGENCITSYDICTCLGFEWGATQYQNFNDVGEALFLLFEISTTEGWVDVMFAAVDSTSIHMQPLKNNGPHHWWLFFLFMMLGAFLFMNLFVGVIIERFNQIRDEMQESEGRTKVFMTAEQEDWSNTQTFILERVKPVKKVTPKHDAAYAIVSHPFFDKFIMGCILLNSMVMGFNHFGADAAFLDTIKALNFVFAFIFTVECVLKNVGMGWSQYIADAWNKFDFVIVIGTLIGIILEAQGIQIGPVALIVRMVRMGRMFRLFNSAKTLKKLFNTIIASIPSLLNVCGLLMILMFVFAVLGVQMFATYAESGDITEHANFRNLWDALHTLFRFSTGENWNGVMHEMYLNGQDSCHPTDPPGIEGFDSFKSLKRMTGYPKRDWDSFDAPYGWCDWGMTNEIERTWGLNGCDPDEDPEAFVTCCRDLNGCADIALLRIYFYLFTIVVTFVMFNLAVGIILDAFDSAGQEETSMLSEEHLRIFVEDWSKFDEGATYCIKLSQLRDFFQILDKPMGFGEEVHASDEQLLFRLLELDLVVRESNISAQDAGETKFEIFDVASALGRRVCKMEVIAKKQMEGDVEPVVLEPVGEVAPYLQGVSHSPANDLITSYFLDTYGVRPPRPGAAPAAVTASAPPVQAPPQPEPAPVAASS